jgi:hypothetical protein
MMEIHQQDEERTGTKADTISLVLQLVAESDQPRTRRWTEKMRAFEPPDSFLRDFYEFGKRFFSRSNATEIAPAIASPARLHRSCHDTRSTLSFVIWESAILSNGAVEKQRKHRLP